MTQTTKKQRGIWLVSPQKADHCDVRSLCIDADCVAELEAECRVYRLKVEELDGDRQRAHDTVAELEAELETIVAAAVSAEQEVTQLRAGLEKVRIQLRNMVAMAEGMDVTFDHAGFRALKAQLTEALTGVDHGEMTADEEVIADSDYAANISPYGFGDNHG
jgi:hypothetical protein